MTQDIRLSIDFRDHPKIVRLHKLLGDPGICSLVTLWAWARKYRPRGILSSMDADDIENGAKWAGETGLFVKTIVALKLLDLNDGTYWVHDWKEHQPWAYYSEERSQRARLAAEGRWRQKKESSTRSSSRAGRLVRIAEETHTGSIDGFQKTDAPSPPPDPDPDPSPIPSPTPTYESETPYARTAMPSLSPSRFESRKGTASKSVRRPQPESLSEYQIRAETFIEEFLARDLSTWEQAYPAINVRADALKAKLWLFANPKNRKKNLERFITNWFARSQEKGARGKVAREPDCPYSPGTPEHEEYLAAAKRWGDQG
jgi:hypothetical protein